MKKYYTQGFIHTILHHYLNILKNTIFGNIVVSTEHRHENYGQTEKNGRICLPNFAATPGPPPPLFFLLIKKTNFRYTGGMEKTTSKVQHFQ